MVRGKSGGHPSLMVEKDAFLIFINHASLNKIPILSEYAVMHGRSMPSYPSVCVIGSSNFYTKARVFKTLAPFGITQVQ